MRILLVCALIAAATPVIAVPIAVPDGGAPGPHVLRGRSPPESARPPPPPPATLTVSGQAQISKTPDRVYIDLGVTTQAPRSQVATAQNAAKASAVIAAIKRVAGPSAQLTTTEYSVTPSYKYPREGGTPTLVGYSASNVVRVRLDDLTRTGRVIDAATQAGSNNVQNIRFALRDEQAARTEALREAAVKARQDADALVGALGLKVERILAVSDHPETGPVPLYPQSRSFKMSVAAAPTPVEAGTLDVSATVTLTVEVAPAKR